MDVLPYRKCGEIIITVKNNAKKIYSFNCLFCDAICLQMKKFSLHLEQEHEDELVLEGLTIENASKEEVVKEETGISEILMPEMKNENCAEETINIHLTENELEKKEGRITRQSKKKGLPLISPDPLEDVETSAKIVKKDDEELQEPGGMNTRSKRKITNLNLITKPIMKSNESDTEIFTEGNNNDDIDQEDDNSEEVLSSNEISNDSDLELQNLPKPAIKFKQPKPPKVNDKRILNALIEFYKSKPLLWDNEHPDNDNLQLKEDTLQNFINDLNDEFKTKLKMKTITRQLNVIVRDYSKELEKQLKDGDHMSELWFFDQMEFLKSHIENKLKHKRLRNRAPVKPLSNDIFSALVDIYKDYNSLWDVNDLAFTIKEKRQETLELMATDLREKLHLELDITKLERQLYYLHKIFATEKLAQLECDDMGMIYESPCPFYNKCEFLQNNQGPFRCTNCQEIVDTYNNYQVHKAKHENIMPFKCPDCGLTFKKIGNYSLHCRRHLRVFKYICNICGKGYPVTSELDLHMRSHTGAHPYLCSMCGEGFRAAIAYDNHIRRHENRFKYRCHICKRGFNNMTRHNDHVKAHLNVRDIICTICGKGFTSRKYMNQHKRIHGGKNYVCNICGKAFAQDSGLRAHKRNHGTPLSLSQPDKYSFLNSSNS